jgi:predicted GIY-YIG superfamily endonuclease
VNKPSQLNQSGIYKIQNKTNGKLYVGSSKNIRKRWKSHRAAFRRNKHHNNHLASAFKIYGLNGFRWEVIEFVKVNELHKREQFWLDFYRSFEKENGYNNSPTAFSPLGVKHTDEARKNMSLAHMGIKRTKAANKKIARSQWKKVFQFDNDGKLCDTFKSMLEAEKKTGISRQLISMCCRGVTNTAKGYFWSTKNKFTRKPDKRFTIKT